MQNIRFNRRIQIAGHTDVSSVYYFPSSPEALTFHANRCLKSQAARLCWSHEPSEWLTVGAALLWLHQSNMWVDEVHLPQPHYSNPSLFAGHQAIHSFHSNTENTKWNSWVWGAFELMLEHLILQGSVHVVKVLGDPKSFINAAVVKGKLLLGPRLDGENIVWKEKSKPVESANIHWCTCLQLPVKYWRWAMSLHDIITIIYGITMIINRKVTAVYFTFQEFLCCLDLSFTAARMSNMFLEVKAHFMKWLGQSSLNHANSHAWNVATCSWSARLTVSGLVFVGEAVGVSQSHKATG